MMITLRTCFLLALSALFSPGFSQIAIRPVEQADPTDLVTAPYFYWDYLKTQTDGWLDEVWDTTTGNWKNNQKIKSDKDGSGRFIEHETQAWWMNQWSLQYAATHQYVWDANNKLSDVHSTIKGDDYKTSLQYNTSGTIAKATYFYKGAWYNECFFWYNQAGQRITDTTVYANSRLKDVRHYQYDANGKCVGFASIKITDHSADTIDFEQYTYSGNQLARITQITTGFGGGQPYRHIDFNYTGTTIKEVIFYDYNIGQQPSPGIIYRHYYTGSRLDGMVRIESPAAPLPVGDSIAFSHNANGQLDTGYLYTLTGTGWNTPPSNRLTFSHLNTGLSDILLQNTTVVYPNPFANHISVDIDAKNDGFLSLAITDITGKVIKTVNQNINAGKNTITISTDGLAAGMYYLTNGTSAIKLVKQ